jgi:hypothetical protein
MAACGVMAGGREPRERHQRIAKTSHSPSTLAVNRIDFEVIDAKPSA